MLTNFCHSSQSKDQLGIAWNLESCCAVTSTRHLYKQTHHILGFDIWVFHVSNRSTWGPKCSSDNQKFPHLTVDGWNPANQLRLVVYPAVFRVFLHPRWCRISDMNSSTHSYKNPPTLYTDEPMNQWSLLPWRCWVNLNLRNKKWQQMIRNFGTQKMKVVI